MIKYSINDLEKITGIKAHTIRIWEKRYRVVTPERTQTNIRLYCDEDLKRLLNISTLNKHGFKISHIINMEPAELNEKIIEISGSSSDYESQINSLVVSMIEMDEDTFEKIISNGVIKIGFEKTVTHILYPFLEKIGVLWQIGTVNPAQEHFITNLIRQKLIIAIDGQAHSKSIHAKTFMLYLPESEMHELGLLFAAYILKKIGQKVIYLGQNVPLNNIVEIIKVRNADFLMTFFVAANPIEEIEAYLKRVTEELPDKKIIISGQQLKNRFRNPSPNIIVVESIEKFKHLINELVMN